MTYTFDFTERDALHFTLFRILHTPMFKWTDRIALILLLTAPLLPILLFLQDILEDAPWEPTAVLIQTVLTAVLCIMLYRIYRYLSERIIVQKVQRSMEEMRAAHAFGMRTIVFEELRIVERRGHTEHTMSYRSITDICLTDQAVCLFTAPMAAIVLPLHIFPSENEKGRLLALIRAKMP